MKRTIKDTGRAVQLGTSSTSPCRKRLIEVPVSAAPYYRQPPPHRDCSTSSMSIHHDTQKALVHAIHANGCCWDPMASSAPPERAKVSER